MSEAKHTPGPWTFSKNDELGDTRFYVAQQEGAPYTPHYSDVATLIAETVSSERRSIQEANARLIAAAPELLEALRGLLDRVVQMDLPLSDPERVAAQMAIAKATGEST